MAPDEVVLVDGLLALDDAAALRRLSGRGDREPLGFGLAEAAALATPVVWLVLHQVASTLAGVATEGALRRTGHWLKRVVRRPSAPEVLPALERSQLAEVRRQVLEAALLKGAAPEQAQGLADAVVAALVLEPAPAPAPDPAPTSAPAEIAPAEPPAPPPGLPEEGDPAVGATW
ncbi:hypothetical protein [Streptomyces sp. NPDC097619]|uniref:hypothetical protein n=1 Tax=Streptomyces sp. NPDC097619 TaxID=3157228 RepID=UPI003326FAF9